MWLTNTVHLYFCKQLQDTGWCHFSHVVGRNLSFIVDVCTGERHRESVVQSIAANLEGWTREVKRETAVYHTLNKLSVDVTRKVLVAEAWVPTAARAQVQEALQTAAQRSSASVSTAALIFPALSPPCS